MASEYAQDERGWAEAGRARLIEVLANDIPEPDRRDLIEAVSNAGLVVLAEQVFLDLLDKAAAYDRLYRIVHPDDMTESRPPRRRFDGVED